MKHTHKGNCQICGALQAAVYFNALPSMHTLAKHGYKVAGFGYFAGVCHGAIHAPIQESRIHLDAMCVDLARHANDQEAMALAYRCGKLIPDTVLTGRSARDAHGKLLSETIAWADANKYQRKDECNRLAYAHDQEARAARAHIKSMLQIAERVHGQPLVPVTRTAPAPFAIYTGLDFMVHGTRYRVTGRMHGGNRWWVQGNTGKSLMTSESIRAAITGR